jgi:CRISPR-associated endonuclease/helicase Cas3
MAKCKVNRRDDVEILEEYVCEDVENTLMFKSSLIKGNGDSDESLLVEMAKVHEIVKEIDKIPKKFRELYFENKARDPETPIFLSYKPKELEKYNKKAHKNAYYYAIGLKQPIGIIQLNKLKKGDENEK